MSRVGVFLRKQPSYDPSKDLWYLACDYRDGSLQAPVKCEDVKVGRKYLTWKGVHKVSLSTLEEVVKEGVPVRYCGFRGGYFIQDMEGYLATLEADRLDSLLRGKIHEMTLAQLRAACEAAGLVRGAS